MDEGCMYAESSPFKLSDLNKHGPFSYMKESEMMPGIHTPYIYLGNQNTFFPWHREDMNYYAVNHLLWGRKKYWFCIRPEDTSTFLRFVRKQYRKVIEKNCSLPVQHKNFWFDPYVLLSEGIDVFFFAQEPGDIMITPPGGFHCGFNEGPNVAESVNFMTWDLTCWKRCSDAMKWLCHTSCRVCINHPFTNISMLTQRVYNKLNTNSKLSKDTTCDHALINDRALARWQLSSCYYTNCIVPILSRGIYRFALIVDIVPTIDVLDFEYRFFFEWLETDDFNFYETKSESIDWERCLSIRNLIKMCGNSDKEAIVLDHIKKAHRRKRKKDAFFESCQETKENVNVKPTLTDNDCKQLQVGNQTHARGT
ncbi:hypothetical protein RFI_17825 [Reticulomyxa filosa]|uniref:JmjC domain-containing protein n=1 Tax=Reticulomyxa filosa TaxID=46433 RepID=X6N0L3_RETFI|nr:hypothetical protein RFI_17825 [Reticulomyxa filosa]|eukprot:ETO19413.1 hypothetical protein RFI_17825 [Reticulomyxa filosa]